ncbi:hypothetical protein Lesp02_65870 [Lentzea sp. NBRC 105346]|uniref:DUF4232 domain-containing protein n=1 Tax=Lentzea sp. NBRC 105346 TaxID=3032205 RepID=UPI0024A00F9E|nr:DUF4232 domain-containing protein [Lentzea sp. NBRC 105346]GLZ34400.1 hypothetical protein Lesp02_65870 [Lentzea sp. NBRC 105346]
MTRRLLVCGLLLLATACGQRQQPATSASLPVSTPPPTTSSSAAPDIVRCNASVLSGEITPTDAGAGNRYGKFFVTNKGAEPCTLNGYSGLQLLAADGSPLPTKLERVTDPGPAPMELAPAARAAANLHWSVVPNGSEPADKPCQPEPSKAAAIPPDETKPLSLTWDYGPVCSGGRIEISAFYPA